MISHRKNKAVMPFYPVLRPFLNQHVIKLVDTRSVSVKVVTTTIIQLFVRTMPVDVAVNDVFFVLL